MSHFLPNPTLGKIPLFAIMFGIILLRARSARQLINEEWFDEKKFIQIIKIFRKRENDLITATKGSLAALSLAYQNYMPALSLVYLAEQPVYNKVKKLLSQSASPAKTEELLDYLNLPLEDSFYKKEEYNLARTKDLKAHAKEYAWITSRYGSSAPYTIEDARRKLAGIDKRKFLAEYAKEKKRLKKIITEAKKIIGKGNEYLVDAFQFIIFYRTHRTDIMNKAAYLYIPKLRKIATEKKLSYEQILFCTIDELLSGKNFDKNIINQRLKGHAMVIDKGMPKCLIGAEYEKIKKIFHEDLDNAAEIKGAVASGGLVKGLVKIVFSKNDFSKVKEGDILVSSMTTPDMVPIMKKASGFITDEGGITCHAAIVAREMKKPCIIGTKIATQVLKDGDLVEVDANKGIVRKLSRR